MRPQLLGPGQLEHVDGASGPGRRWTVRVPAESRGRTRLQIAPRRPGTSDFVGNVAVEVVQPRAIPIRAGPAQRRVDGQIFETGRGLGWLGLWLMTQLLFIALPEEFFYRGYLQTRVGHAIEATRREGEAAGGDGDPEEGGMRSWWGISEANVIASVVFGLGHLLIPIGGQLLATRISVAFPALLFGWLRDRTGSITASVVYHAACNMMVLVAAPHFF